MQITQGRFRKTPACPRRSSRRAGKQLGRPASSGAVVAVALPLSRTLCGPWCGTLGSSSRRLTRSPLDIVLTWASLWCERVLGAAGLVLLLTSLLDGRLATSVQDPLLVEFLLSSYTVGSALAIGIKQGDVLDGCPKLATCWVCATWWAQAARSPQHNMFTARRTIISG